MKRPLSRAAVWLPLLLSTLPALAADPPAGRAAAATWTAVGPNGGAINVLAAGAHALYAGTSGGVYVSANEGASWTLQARQIGQQPIYALAIDPLHPNVLYAGTRSQGVWKSADGAASWTPATSGLPRLPVSALAIDPVHSSVLYAAVSAGLTDAVPSGPYKSMNGGRTWALANGGLPRDVILGLAVDPMNSAVLYAATPLHGLWRSGDGGATWNALDAPFDGALRVAVRTAGNPGGMGGTLVYAVSTADGGPEGIFRSDDAGATWSEVTPDGVALDADLPLAFGPGGLVYTQGAKSADSGDHWTPTSTFGLPARALLVDPTQPATVYGASDRGLWKSRDGAASWAGASRGLHATAIPSVAVHPVSGGVLAGVDGSGLIRLRQNAKAEDPSAWQPVYGETPGFVVFDPSRPSTLYAGLNGIDRYGQNRIARSADGGTTWVLLSLADRCLDLLAFAIDPTNSKVLYAGGMGNGDSGCAPAPSLTWKSTDGGITWRRLTLFAAQRIVVDPAAPGTVYALGSSATAVFKSADGGTTWHPASGGLPAGTIGSTDIGDLVLDPSAPGRLFISNAAGIYGSVDGAKSWQRVSRAIQNATVLRVDPADPEQLYAGIPGVGVFVSRDGGKGWSPLSDTHLPALFSGALEIDPTTPGRLYVGTAGAGLFRVDVAP